MRTNVVLDEGLVEQAFQVSEAKTKKDLIHEALEILVRLRRRKDLTDLAGKIEFAEGFDHKKLRKTRP